MLDYKVGNLGSILRALEFLGAEAHKLEGGDASGNYDALILPGVGAFGDGMKNLTASGLRDYFLRWVEGGRPALGICLGMQLLMTRSFEFGTHKGLNLIAGDVERIKPQEGFKIPHIGWNALRPSLSSGLESWGQTILEGLDSGVETYFVHSFAVVPSNPDVTLAKASYGGYDFCAVLRQDKIFGCQFHPEKSGEIGLQILRNFLAGL